ERGKCPVVDPGHPGEIENYAAVGLESLVEVVAQVRCRDRVELARHRDHRPPTELGRIRDSETNRHVWCQLFTPGAILPGESAYGRDGCTTSYPRARTCGRPVRAQPSRRGPPPSSGRGRA